MPTPRCSITTPRRSRASTPPARWSAGSSTSTTRAAPASSRAPSSAVSPAPPPPAAAAQADQRRLRGLGLPQARALGDLVRSEQQRRWNREAERAGGLRVDDQLEPGRLLDREIRRLRPLEDLVR